MPDLTSKYSKKELRDISIQGCINSIDASYLLYPHNYIKGRFTDFFDIQGGTQPPKSQFIHTNEEGYVRFLQIRDFSTESTITYIPKDKKNKLCEAGDVLLGRYGASVGKILTGKAGAYNVACAKVIILNHEGIDKDYLFYLLHSSVIQNSIKNISRSAQGGFNKNDLSKINLVIPKLRFQEKILGILRAIDNYLINDAPLSFDGFNDDFIQHLVEVFNKHLSVSKEIDALSNILNLQQTYLQQLRQSILKEAVQGKLSEQNPSDEDATALLKRIKAEKLKLIKEGKLKKEKELPPIKEDEIPFELPNGWAWCRLSDIATIGTGATPLTSNKNYYNGDIPWITSSATGNLFVTEAEKCVSEIAIKETNCKVYPTGTLIVAMYGQGKTRGQVTELLIEAATNQACAAIELIDNNENHRNYIKYFFQKIYLEIRELAEGGAQPNLNLQKIKDALIPLPPSAEQKCIVSKVQELQQQLSQLESQVQQSREYAKQLLQAVLKEAFEEKGTVYEITEQKVGMVAEERI